MGSSSGVQAVREYFDRQAGAYRARLEGGIWRLVRAAESRAVLRACGGVAKATVLDAGCGTGFYSDAMRRAGAREVFGVDFSDAMIAAYRAAGFEGCVGDLATLDLARSFDLVLCAGALEFVPDPAAVVARLAAHLGPRGRLVLLVPRRSALGGLYVRFHRGHGVAARLFSGAGLDSLAAGAGLQRDTPHLAPWFALVAGYSPTPCR